MKYQANCILLLETIRKALKYQSFQRKLTKTIENTKNTKNTNVETVLTGFGNLGQAASLSRPPEHWYFVYFWYF